MTLIPFSTHSCSGLESFYFYLHSGTRFSSRWRSIFIVTIIILFIYSGHVMTWCTRVFSFSIFYVFHTKYENSLFIRFGQKKFPKNKTIIIKMSDINPLFYIFHVAMHTCSHTCETIKWKISNMNSHFRKGIHKMPNIHTECEKKVIGYADNDFRAFLKRNLKAVYFARWWKKPLCISSSYKWWWDCRKTKGKHFIIAFHVKRRCSHNHQ